MIVIIDYDVGNLASVAKGFERAGMTVTISKDPVVIEQASVLILPGVGAFGDAMHALQQSGLVPLIKNHVASGQYLFGICLGMQLLYETSFEHGRHDGLGLLQGTIEYLDASPKVPHMGWNQLIFEQPKSLLLRHIKEKEHVYFVHSYYVNTTVAHVVAYADYGVSIPAIVHQDNIIATQFHPEKSGRTGLNLLKAFKELINT